MLPTRGAAVGTALLSALILWLALLAVLAPVVVSAASVQLAPRILAAFFAAIFLALAGVGAVCTRTGQASKKYKGVRS